MLVFALQIVAAGQSFTCSPVRVWDGDGPIWCAEGPRIRLSGIATREMDGACSKGHPCPTTSAKASQDALIRLVDKPIGKSNHGHILVKGPALKCVSVGGAGGKRTAAWCRSPTAGDLSCAMVTSGKAAKWMRYWGKHACE